MVRYKALDAFRGLTIALMVLVNNPGSWSYVYWPLEHSKWNGLTPTDLVFPFFVFIVGSAMFFAFQKINFQLTSGVAQKIIRRGLTLFAIGVVLNTALFSVPLENLRIMGVMQRLGLVYIFASFIVLAFDKRGIWLMSLALLLTYWGLAVFFGGADPYSIEHAAARALDHFIIGDSHVYRGGGVPFDPEGILSTLPAIVNALIGFEATRFLTSQSNKQQAIVKLFSVGVVLMAVAFLWDLVMPINKALWTSSFVVATSGAALMMLSVFIWIVDVKNQTTLVKPLLVFGMNPLFVYIIAWVASDLVNKIKMTGVDGKDIGIQAWFVDNAGVVVGQYNASLIAASFFVLFCYVVAYVLYRKNIVIKI